MQGVLMPSVSSAAAATVSTRFARDGHSHQVCQVILALGADGHFSPGQVGPEPGGVKTVNAWVELRRIRRWSLVQSTSSTMAAISPCASRTMRPKPWGSHVIVSMAKASRREFRGAGVCVHQAAQCLAQERHVAIGRPAPCAAALASFCTRHAGLLQGVGSPRLHGIGAAIASTAITC